MSLKVCVAHRKANRECNRFDNAVGSVLIWQKPSAHCGDLESRLACAIPHHGTQVKVEIIRFTSLDDLSVVVVTFLLMLIKCAYL